MAAMYTAPQLTTMTNVVEALTTQANEWEAVLNTKTASCLGHSAFQKGKQAHEMVVAAVQLMLGARLMNDSDYSNL